MPRTVTLVTGNAHKLKELQALAAASDLEFTSQKIDLDEIQSLDVRQIVGYKLRQAYAMVKQPVVVEDVSAELDSLNGLPGPFIKFFEQRLGSDALYQLQKVQNDHVIIRCIAGYYDGQRLLFGKGVVTGRIVAPRGDNGFGFDSVVEPDGQSPKALTMAEMSPTEKAAISHRGLALRDLLQQLQ